MFATAPATTRPARSSRGKEMMRTTRPPVVDGLSLALQAASSDTSTSTTARIQASYAIVTDFFNGLLGPTNGLTESRSEAGLPVFRCQTLNNTSPLSDRTFHCPLPQLNERRA